MRQDSGFDFRPDPCPAGGAGEVRHEFFAREFPERLAALRKERGMARQAPADQAGPGGVQICRYEGGHRNLPWV